MNGISFAIPQNALNETYSGLQRLMVEVNKRARKLPKRKREQVVRLDRYS